MDSTNPEATSNAQLKSISTEELAQEFCARLSEGNGINFLSQEMLACISNLCEAEYINRMESTYVLSE